MGEPVRYDGTDRYESIIGEMDPDIEFISLCPEAGAGLGVPRTPVRLVRMNHQLHALGVEDDAIDVTDVLNAYSHKVVKTLDHLSGFILKSRSPSCAIVDAQLYDQEGELTGNGAGLFVRILHARYPQMPLTTEAYLGDEDLRKIFLDRVHLYHQRSV